MMVDIKRFPENPIIRSEMDDSIGANINGPSLIRVPGWVRAPLGRYYLYFAHHQGLFIRLAYANDLHGPWKIYTPGTLHTHQTCCQRHIASPDVHVDEERREIVMYFHGCMPTGQRSFRAVSQDGLSFQASDEDLGPCYFRVFQHEGWTYAIAMDAPSDGGVILRSADGETAFESGPEIIARQRHVAVLKRGTKVQVFFSRGEDRPERILVTEMDLAGDWRSWQPGEPAEVLAPAEEYEGGLLSLEASRFGAIHEPVRQVRDPAIFEEGGRTYLLYSSAGENGLCMAELVDRS